jgi:hypothetical protein
MPGLTDALGDAAMPVSLGIGALETGIDIIQNIKAKKERNRLLAQEKAYQTPQEIYDALSASENYASQGFDPITLNYLNTQTNQAFSSGVNSAEFLGADPNTLSSLFGQKIDSIMKIGAQNHQLNTQNFSQYLNALNTLGANKAAEQRSQQDILKDKIQAESANVASSAQGISNGLNTMLSSLDASAVSSLYNPDGTPKRKKPANLAVDNTYQGAYSNYDRGYMV